MADTRQHPLLSYLRRLLGPAPSGVADADLLRRHVRQHDEAAFELLLWRHAATVWRVCRQVLRDDNAAEDAFQATFLVLIRKAGSIRRSESLGGWLYRVAFRIALKARAQIRHRQSVEREAPSIDPPAADDTESNDSRRIICEEVDRLPAKYRAPVIACYFEGNTHEEAAQRLGWPRGTVAGRLSRARELLRRRLVRRGLTFSLAALTGALPAQTSRAALSGLISLTLQNAKRFAAVPPQIVSLAEGVLQTMYWTRVKIVAVVLLLAGLGGTGASLLGTRTSTAEPPQQAEQPAAALPPSGGGGSAAIKQPKDRAKIVPDRELSKRNLHELALAMQNYADTYQGSMLAPAIYGKDGKALLSWRVELLPFLGEGELYKQFKRDEPWDGPHNKKLLSKMPKIFSPLFVPPGVTEQRRETTYYQVFVSTVAKRAGAGGRGRAGSRGAGGPPGGRAGGAGSSAPAQHPAASGTSGSGASGPGGAGGAGGPGGSSAAVWAPDWGITAAFVKGQRVLFPAHFTDGTSNTILIVESGHAVPWTKPEDLHFVADEPLPELGDLFPDVFHAALADGSVRTLSKQYDEANLRAAITSNAGDLFEWSKIEALGQANADRRQRRGDGERMRQLLDINEKLKREAERNRAERNRLLEEKQQLLEEMLQEVKRSRGSQTLRPTEPIQKKTK